MPDRIVLMLAYHFPPENAIGAARPYHFYKYLSQMGYRCHVITAADQETRPDLDSEYIPDPFMTQPREEIGWQLERAARKLLVPGGTGIRWSRLACRAAHAFLRSNPNAEVTIFSSYPPLGTHVAAFQLTRSSQLKWIADFRDPLADVPGHIGLTRFQQKLSRWLERTVLETATVTIVNTDAAAEKFRNTYPKQRNRIHLIWNGFDPEDRIERHLLPERDYQLVSHVGELYGGRNVSPLLESVSRLIEAGRLVSTRIRIRLVGPIESDSVPGPEFLMRARQQGWLELFPELVPQHEARRIAQDSDGLLLVQPQSAIQVPGKLFEYLRLGRPVLAFILPNTPIERILKQSGVVYRCAYADSSIQEMDNAVQSFIDLDKTADQANIWFEENFNAKKQTMTLDALIRSIHGRQRETT
jgi:glycosyltransferase involved in cell wall biosynthesis